MLKHSIFTTLPFAHTHSIKLRWKFNQSRVFNIFKSGSTILPDEEIIRHNICNIELQTNINDV